MGDATIQADAVIDTSGMCCPVPVIEAKKAATSAVEVGQVFELISTDPGSVRDMQAWAANTGHELLASEDSGGGTYRYWIRRTT